MSQRVTKINVGLKHNALAHIRVTDIHGLLTTCYTGAYLVHPQMQYLSLCKAKLGSSGLGELKKACCRTDVDENIWGSFMNM